MNLDKPWQEEVKEGLYECLECMVPNESEQVEIHRYISSFNRATGTFGKTLAKKARDEDQPGKQFQISKNQKFD